MKKKITTSLILITFAFCSFAQVHLDKSMKSNIESIENLKTITFVKSSENQEVLFDINGSSRSMDIVIHYLLNSGEFKLEIYDPQGVIYEQAVTIDSKYEFAGFPLPNNKVRLDEDAISEIEKGQNVEGRLVWFVDKPEEGKWKVLLIPNEADGKVTITFNE